MHEKSKISRTEIKIKNLLQDQLGLIIFYGLKIYFSLSRGLKAR